MYKTAIIGCGRRARAHLPGIVADERLRLAALADVSEEARTAFAADCAPAATLYADHRELLAVERPEVVVTCLWTPLHLEVFRDCAEAGVKAVLSEKPMAPTWGECQEIARLAEATGCQLTFSHQRRFCPGNLLARRWLAEGLFGDLLRFELYSPPNLLDCGTHTFDQALSFNGEVPAKWVLGAVDVREPVKWFGVDAEGLSIGLVVFENGVRATYQVGGPDKDLPTGLRLHGTKGFLEVGWDGEFGRGALYDDPTWRPEGPTADGEQVMRDYVRDAVDCLASGTEPVNSHRKALRASEIIFGLYESVRRHERVDLPVTVEDSAYLTMLAEGAFARA